MKSVLVVALATTGACAAAAPATAQRAIVAVPEAEPEPELEPEPTPAHVEPEPDLPQTVVAGLDIACGDCHRSDRESAKAEALAVFDLVQERWWGELDAAELDGAQLRVDGKDAFTDQDKVVFARFVAERKKRLADSPS